jgi:adenylate cyclase
MTEPDDLQEALLADMPSQVDQRAIEDVGLELTDGLRLWRALGFPEPETPQDFGQSDFWAMGEVAQIMKHTGMDLSHAVALTRGVGTTMSRLAEWQVGLFASFLDELESEDDRQQATRALLTDLRPRFESLLYYGWRRHLAASVARLLSNDDSQELSMATVGFADLVQFSALSNELNPEEVGELVELFEGNSHDKVSEHGGRVIKGLGDSVLFVAPNPEAGIAIAWEIIDMVSRVDLLPDVRAGVVYGSVVKRMGDVFGPAVNLASRLTAVARRNRVITDEHTAALLPKDFVSRVLPAREVRGFGVIEPVSVGRPGTF